MKENLRVNGKSIRLYIDREVWPVQVVAQTEYLGRYEGNYMSLCYGNIDSAFSVDEALAEVTDVIRDCVRFPNDSAR